MGGMRCFAEALIGERERPSALTGDDDRDTLGGGREVQGPPELEFELSSVKSLISSSGGSLADGGEDGEENRLISELGEGATG